MARNSIRGGKIPPKVKPNTCLECKYHEAVETDPYFYTIVCNNPERKNHILTGETVYYGCDVGEMKMEDEVEDA